MVDLVADRAGVEVGELVAAAVEAASVIVAMIGAVRVVKAAMTGVVRGGSGSRVVRVVMIAVASGVGRGVSGSRVVKVGMNVVVRVVTIVVGRVGSGSRVVKVGMNVVARVVTIVVGRVGSGSRVVRAVMTVVLHVAMGNVMTAVRDSVTIAMMRQSLRRSSVARRCSHVRARVSTAKASRLPTDRIGTSVSSTRARCATSAFGVANPSARSAGRGGIEVARRSQHHPL